MGTRSQRAIIALIVVVAIVAVVIAVRRPTGRSVTPTPTPALAGASHQIGFRTKTAGCVARNALPDAACTPGAVLTTDVGKICTPGYASSVRDVSTATKNAVYAEYGIKSHGPGEYEVDHLISLQLGGSNDIANLWPEPAEPKPGFHEKDKVENYLHDQVCRRAMTIQDAQYAIATDWLAVYRSMPS